MNPFWDLLLAIKASLATIPGVPTVDVRYDVAEFDPKIDTLPLIIVAPADERFGPARDAGSGGGTFRAKVFYDYAVDIAWIVGSGRSVKSGLEAYLAMEWAIQTKLTHVTIASAFDTNQGPLLASRFPAGSNLRVRGWSFRYRTREDRTS